MRTQASADDEELKVKSKFGLVSVSILRPSDGLFLFFKHPCGAALLTKLRCGAARLILIFDFAQVDFSFLY